MVAHIVLWNLIDSLSEAQKKEAGQKIKEIVEALKDQIPGVIDISVSYDPMDTSNREVALVSHFESEEALKNYIVHPAHVEVGKYVKSVTCDRACVDYQV